MAENGSNMWRALAKLQNIDRRVMYILVIVFSTAVIGFTLVRPILLKNVLGSETLGVFEVVDKCPPDKVILVDSSWDWGSQAENRPQFEAVVDHMMRKGTRFVIVSIGVTPYAPDIAQEACERLGAKYGRQYGTDWVNLGYVHTGGGVAGGMGFFLNSMAKDFHGMFPQDIKGTPIGNIDIMADLRDINDGHMVFCCTYAPDPAWLSFIRGQYGTPIAFGAMSIMSPMYYPFMDSEQLVGFLVGIRGAAEYEAEVEKRVKFEGEIRGGNEPREFPTASTLIIPQAFAHILIIVFIIIGNVGYFAARKVRKEG